MNGEIDHSEKVREFAGKRSNREEQKICAVCGDKALGYNFNAVTCESCKAFFRRNALKNKPLKCRNSGSCNITISSRRYCPKCRLEKCLRVGMLADLITVRPPDDTDDGPRIMSKKRRSTDAISITSPIRNCLSGSGMPSFPPPLGAPFTGTPPDQNDYNLPSVANLDDTTVDQPYQAEIVELQKKLDACDQPGDPLIPLPKSLLMHLINFSHGSSLQKPMIDYPPSAKPTTIACICRVGSRTDNGCVKDEEAGTSCSEELDAGGSEEAHCSKLERRSNRTSVDWTRQAIQIIESALQGVDDRPDRILDLVRAGPVVEFPPDFDASKLFKLEELLSANEILTPPCPTEGPPLAYADSGLAAAMMDLAIRRTLEMMKCVNAFAALSPRDRVTLYTGAIRELICLRGLMVYDSSANSFRPVGYPYRYLRLDALRRCPDGHPILKRFYNSFRSSWRKCDAVMLCLTSMVCFEPSRSNLTDVSAVRYQHEFYQDLLKRYLRSVHSPMEAEEVFGKLMRLLRVMRDNLDHFCPPIHLEMNTAGSDVMLTGILPQ